MRTWVLFLQLHVSTRSMLEASVFFLGSVCVHVWTKAFSRITKWCISSSSYSSFVCAWRPKPFWWLPWKCPPRSPDTLQNTRDTGLHSSAAGSLHPAITRTENKLVWLQFLIGELVVLVPGLRVSFQIDLCFDAHTFCRTCVYVMGSWFRALSFLVHSLSFLRSVLQPIRMTGISLQKCLTSGNHWKRGGVGVVNHNPSC